MGGLVGALNIRNAGPLSVIPGLDGAATEGLMALVRRWLGLDRTVQSGPGR
jgi:hypothetical protein